DWRLLRAARQNGVKIVINPDSHNVQGLADYRYGVGIARKGWLSAKDVINSMTAGQMAAFLIKQKTAIRK
ncbi:MAG: histidinol-phosphatase, partial [Candidatus Latescibacterota bacterium]